MQDATDVPLGALALRVDPARCPGSVSGAERLPLPGERVYTNEGTAVVVRLLGRTDSGRLLELATDARRPSSCPRPTSGSRLSALPRSP